MARLAARLCCAGRRDGGEALVRRPHEERPHGQHDHVQLHGDDVHPSGPGASGHGVARRHAEGGLPS